MIIAFCPAGKMEQYFRDAEIARQHAGDADFIARYEMEWGRPFAVLESLGRPGNSAHLDAMFPDNRKHPQ
jgi:hypothetical protein